VTPTIAPRAVLPGRTIRTLLCSSSPSAGGLLAGAAAGLRARRVTGATPTRDGGRPRRPPSLAHLLEKVALNDGSLRVLDPKGKPVATGRRPTERHHVRREAALGLPTARSPSPTRWVSGQPPRLGTLHLLPSVRLETSVGLSDQAVAAEFRRGLYGFARYVLVRRFILLVGGAAFVLACWQRGAGVRPCSGSWSPDGSPDRGHPSHCCPARLVLGSARSATSRPDAAGAGGCRPSRVRRWSAVLSRAGALFIAVLFGAYCEA